MQDSTYDDRPRAFGSPEAPERTPPVGVAPPTMPGAVRSVPSGWPVTIGVISIVLAAIGLLGMAFSIFSQAFMPQPPSGTQIVTPTPAMRAWTIGWSIVSGALEVWLIIAAAALIRRRRSSIGSLRTWSIVKIGYSVIGVVVGLWMYRQSFAPTTTSSGTMPAGFLIAIMVMSLLIGLMWTLAWPIICLWWLGRDRVRAEYRAWA